LIGAFVVLVEMAHRAGREDRLHIPQRKSSAHHTPQVRRFAELAATAHCPLPPLLPSSSVCEPAAALPLPLPLTLPPFLFGKE
jgi:hypothetical protein